MKHDAAGPARGGAVLILVLCVLSILALLGMTFVNVQTLHKRISGSWTDTVRAKLLAQSGLEAAVAELRAMAQDPAGPAAGSATMLYYGSQSDETLPAAPDTPVEEALNPSFAVELDGDPSNGAVNADPRAVPIMGVSRGISGMMATGAYGLNADTYTLKVFDTSSQIHVNEGLNHPYQSAVLERILNRLGEDPSIDIVDLGATILANRPPGGYADKGAVAALFAAADAKKFIDLVTCHAWVDKNVANPVPLSNESSAVYFVPTVAPGPTPPIFQTRPTVGGVKLARYGRNRRSDGLVNTTPTMFCGTGAGTSAAVGQTSVYGLDEINPRYIELVERAPVNVNTAPRAVLAALLRDLEGFFLVEQKRWVYPAWNYPGVWAHLQANYNWSIDTPYLNYDWNPQIATSYRYAHTAGEIGVLFRTTPIDETMAGDIADAILARRATEAFGGRQDFSMFVDSLVGTTLVDPRPNSAFAVYPYALTSNYYSLHAAQAIADTIKANFDPNLHLNELNPDLAVNLLVDKTDLIQSSTEFCFHPTGIYEIKSLGRVLRPEGTQDAFTALDNTLMAQARASAVVRLFSIHRESTQKDFYAGTRSNSTSGSATYGNYALAIGPEPDNGPAPEDADYEGYVTLSTYGGSLAVGTQKASSTLQATPTVTTTSVEGQNALVHGHFDLDYRLHAASADHEVLSKTASGYNHKDRTEDLQTWHSPYCGALDTTRYKIAQSYKWTGDSIVATLVAPPDLRIDGAYVERSSAPQYHSLGGNFNSSRGTASYWIKPGYEPEFMGKVRMFFNMDQGGGKMGGGTFTMMHAMTPGYADVDETTSFPGYANSVGRPSRNLFGLTVYSSYSWNGVDYHNVRTPGRSSPITSHFNHPHATNKLRQTWIRHHWVHAVVTWDIGISDPTQPVQLLPWPPVRMYLNGRDPTDETAERTLSASATGGDFWNSSQAPKPYDNIFDNQYNLDWQTPRQMNPIRLGAHPFYDATGTSGGPHFYPLQRSRRVRNYPADATIDEFFLWGLSHTDAATWNKAMAQWNLGRYYRENDGVFTSQPILLGSGPARALAPAGAAPPPPAGEGGAPSSLSVPSAGGGTRVLGISWTVHGVPPASMSAMVDAPTRAAFRYAVHDYQPTMSNADPVVVTPAVDARVSFDDGLTWSDWMTEPTWGALQQTLPAGEAFRYEVRFDSGADPLNSILLSAPILDDVTVYYGDFAYLQLSLNSSGR